MKAAYQELHKEGFEIIGISLDDKRIKLDSFVREEKMHWPQYFSADGGQSDLVLRHGVTEIPTMWLINKKGNLVDMNVHENIASKVKNC